MDVPDTIDLMKPLTKLVEVIANAIGYVAIWLDNGID